MNGRIEQAESTASQPNVLIVAAHPDDAILSMGGSLLRLAECGASIVHLSLSTGSLGAGSDGAVRVREVERAFAEHVAPRMQGGELLLLFGDLPDGSLPATGEPVMDLLAALERDWGSARFDLAFLHWRDDTHVDHVNASRIGHRLARNVGSVLYFDSASSIDFRARVRVDVTEQWSARTGMLSLFEAHPALAAQRRLELSRKLHGTYMIRSQHGAGVYAEPFDVERLDASALVACLGAHGGSGAGDTGSHESPA